MRATLRQQAMFVQGFEPWGGEERKTLSDVGTVRARPQWQGHRLHWWGWCELDEDFTPPLPFSFWLRCYSLGVRKTFAKQSQRIGFKPPAPINGSLKWSKLNLLRAAKGAFNYVRLTRGTFGTFGDGVSGPPSPASRKIISIFDAPFPWNNFNIQKETAGKGGRQTAKARDWSGLSRGELFH